jgi:WhiB family transcriptional regulator, redox-sensing transcriptional regulator
MDTLQQPSVSENKPPMATAGLLSIVDATWNNLSWRQYRACADLDTNMFFPVGFTGNALEQTNLAKSICQSCPVNNQCLEFALRTLQDYGIWGGRTEDERRVIRRSRRAAARRAAVAAKAAAETSLATSSSELMNWPAAGA